MLNIQKRREESKLVGKGPEAAGRMVLGAELLVQKKSENFRSCSSVQNRKETDPKSRNPVVVRNQESHRILLVMGPVFQGGSTVTEHTGLGWHKDCL